MRILMLARANYILAARRADLLREDGHDVRFLSLNTAGSLTEAESLPRGGPIPLRFLTAVPATKLAIRRFKPDLIDAHGATSYGALAALTAGRVPWLLTLYGTDLYFQARRNRILRFIASQSLQRASVVYGSSSAILEDIRALGDTRDLTTCIFQPWGIPLGKPVKQADAQQVRVHMGTPESAFVVIHPRRISSHWRLNWILDRLNELASSTDKSVELWLAYPSPTKQEQMVIEGLLVQSTQGCVKIRLLGPLAHRELMMHLAAADVFVCAALNEMLASSFLEAMYHGAVPVVTRVPAFEEASKWPGATVRLADPEDPNSFLSALQVVSEYDPSTRARIDAANRKTVRLRADDKECLRTLLASVSAKLNLDIAHQ